MVLDSRELPWAVSVLRLSWFSPELEGSCSVTSHRGLGLALALMPKDTIPVLYVALNHGVRVRFEPQHDSMTVRVPTPTKQQTSTVKIQRTS